MSFPFSLLHHTSITHTDTHTCIYTHFHRRWGRECISCFAGTWVFCAAFSFFFSDGRRRGGSSSSVDGVSSFSFFSFFFLLSSSLFFLFLHHYHYFHH
jgi:hypothetical protein